MTVADLTPLLTAQDMAARLCVSDSTIRRMIRTGELPVSRVGKQWRCDADDLEQYIRAHRLDGEANQ